MTRLIPTPTPQPQAGTRAVRAARIFGTGALITASVLSVYGGRLQRAYASGTSCGQATDSNSFDAAIANFNNYSNPCDTLVIAQDFTLTRTPTAIASATKDLTIVGGGHSIDGDDAYRAFAVSLASGDTMTVSDITLRDGAVPTGLPTSGGALTFTGGYLYIDNSVFQGNTATYGGAISTSARLTVTRSVFDGNEAHSDGNHEGRGGAIRTTGAALSITESSLTDNKAVYPSGQTAKGSGGAIHALGTDITIAGSTLANNVSLWFGGAIRMEDGDFHLVNSTVTGNTSRWGGAIYAQMRQAHDMSIDFSTITGNAATLIGGAIYAYSRPAMVVPIANSIISGNLVGQSPADAYGNTYDGYCYSNPCQTEGPTEFALSYSAQTSVGSINQVASAQGVIFSTDPLVASLGDNGGFLLPDGARIATMNPLEGSSALSAANPVTTGFPGDDQRGQGFPRLPATGRADIGAIQRAASPPPPTPSPPVSSPPTPPLGVTAVAGDGSASVSWTAPASAGSFPVTNYQVTSTPGGRVCLTSALSCEVPGLMNGTAYTFTVKALTGAGWSPTSEPSNSTTPIATPRPTITITGSREGKRIAVTGSTTGMDMGGLATPWVSRGARSATPGKSVEVSIDGGFTWSRIASSRTTWSIYFTAANGVRSNTLRIAAR